MPDEVAESGRVMPNNTYFKISNEQGRTLGVMGTVL